LYDIDEYLENPLYKAFNYAVDLMATIDIRNAKTDNTIGLQEKSRKKAIEKGLKVGSEEYYQFCKKYVDPRNIPPSVIEYAISTTKGVAGNTAGTFVHETADVKVIVNSNGKVITVIPK
jgi:hypothetical protein